MATARVQAQATAINLFYEDSKALQAKLNSHRDGESSSINKVNDGFTSSKLLVALNGTAQPFLQRRKVRMGAMCLDKHPTEALHPVKHSMEFAHLTKVNAGMKLSRAAI